MTHKIKVYLKLTKLAKLQLKLQLSLGVNITFAGKERRNHIRKYWISWFFLVMAILLVQRTFRKRSK